MLVRGSVFKGGPSPEYQNPGDIVAGSDNILGGAISTAGAGTWTASAIVNGIIRRTGPGAGYTDTTDTAVNIIAALAGNNAYPDTVEGTTFRMLFINTVAFAMTFAAGTGVVAGTGTVDCAASKVREYIWTILNAQPVTIVQMLTTNGSPTLTVTNQTPNGYSDGPSTGRFFTNGAAVTGSNIAAGSYVIGTARGPNGVTGLTLSANATGTSTSAGVTVTLGPRIQVDALRLSDL